ncbi:MAG TPA: ABC transporter ATP-binding protein [Rhodanobacteraceae bacterium]
MATAPPLLLLGNVCRRLGGRAVLRDVSLQVRCGDVLGLLGVNGAGKSTTLSIMAGALAPTSGRVEVDGIDAAANPGAIHACVGWVPEHTPLWPELTVGEALDACGRLRGMPRAARRSAMARELERLDFGALQHRLCGQLSLGQKRRVGLAQALLHAPELLVLDEPGNGLDPLQSERLRALLHQLAPDHGIVLSSHDLAEVEATCNRVVILHDGRVRHAAALDGKCGRLAERFRAIASTPVDAAA